MLLSVLIPTYNDEHRIEAVVQAIKRAPLPENMDLEIIVIDDASKDHTIETLETFRNDPQVIVVPMPSNCGKGSAVRVGLQDAHGDIILIQDADFEYNPKDYPALLAPLLQKRTRVVYGTRFANGFWSRPVGIRFFQWIANKILSAAVLIICQRSISDEATAYKVFRTDFLQTLDLKSKGFEICSEMTAKTICRSEPIIEVPVSYRARYLSGRKHIRWYHLFFALWALVRYRFSSSPTIRRILPIAPAFDKKVFVICHDQLWPDHGCGAQRTIKIAQALQKEGLPVILIGPSTQPQIYGISVIPVRVPKKGPAMILDVIAFNTAILWTLWKNRHHVGFVVIHNSVGGLGLILFKAIYKIPFALDLADIHVEYLPVRSSRHLLSHCKNVLVRLEMAIIKHAVHVVAVSRSMRRFLIAHGVDAKRITVVHDGVDHEIFKTQKDPDAYRHVAHLGQIAYQNEMEILLKAIPLVLREAPDTEFHFICRGSMVKKTQQLARDLGVEASTHFYGPIPREELHTVLKKCAIGVIQRRDMPANHLTVTGKLLDYWGSGMAVISSRMKAIQEIAQEGQNILNCQPGNPEALAAVIVHLRRNPILLNTLIRNGIDTSQRYQWQRLATLISADILAALGWAPSKGHHPSSNNRSRGSTDEEGSLMLADSNKP